MKQRAVLLVLVMAAAWLSAGHCRAGNIAMKGSDTMVVLAQRWAEAYMSGHPTTKIQVSGGGTGTGLAALQNRTTDICNASRRIKGRETEQCIRAFGKRPTEYRVALDGLSVYVNPANPLEQICLEDLEGVFTGRIRNWRELGGPDAPINLYSRENSSGTYELFKDEVLKGLDFASTAQTLQGTAQVLEAVSRDPFGIGYGGAAYGQGARHLRISKTRGGDAIEPDETSVLQGTYPISRYLYCYVDPAADAGEVAEFLRWIRGAEGQKLVREVGYFPLPSSPRKP